MPNAEEPIRILADSPWENGHNERFDGTLRCEMRDAEWVITTSQAQPVVDIEFKQFSHVRLHEALGTRPTVPQTIKRMGKDHAQTMADLQTAGHLVSRGPFWRV
ncbi:MAG: integrase core domain-containing protein [Pseudomonadota bacterium]